MDRWLLNTLPTSVLALIVVGGAVVIAVGGFLTMKRWVPSLAGNADSRSPSSAFGMASGLFSFVLAFTIGQLYTNFTRSNADAKQEATVLAQVLRTSQGLPGVNVTIRQEVLEYAHEVRTVEWDDMEHGNSSVLAWHQVDAMYKTLEAHRSDLGSNPLYSQVLARVNDLVNARRTRLDDANIALPDVFQLMLVLGAILALSTTFYFKPFGERIQIVMIGCAAVLVGTAMLVALMLDFPYSGGIAVSSQPFAPATLLLLSGG
jgi:hypothetical protein